MEVAEDSKRVGAERGARLGRFALRVLRRFSENRGLLLAGAVAYNALLSVVPLGALLLVGLSTLVDEERVMRTIEQELHVVAPAVATRLAQDLQVFVYARKVVGWGGLALALFFSALAFRALDQALESITRHAPRRRRKSRLGWLRPYVYVSVIGVGLLLLTIATSWLEHAEAFVLGRFAWAERLVDLVSGGSGAALYALTLTGQVLLLSSFYMVIPSVHVRASRALVGGIVATGLWEITRRILVWYVAELSLVSLLYGSLSTAVIALLGLEIGAAIVLLGAQVIAELERSEAAGVPWHLDPATAEQENGAVA